MDAKTSRRKLNVDSALMDLRQYATGSAWRVDVIIWEFCTRRGTKDFTSVKLLPLRQTYQQVDSQSYIDGALENVNRVLDELGIVVDTGGQ